MYDPQCYCKFCRMEREDITEVYTVDPQKGIAALMVGIQKEGYELKSIDRKDDKATIVWKKKIDI